MLERTLCSTCDSVICGPVWAVVGQVSWGLMSRSGTPGTPGTPGPAAQSTSWQQESVVLGSIHSVLQGRRGFGFFFWMGVMVEDLSQVRIMAFVGDRLLYFSVPCEDQLAVFVYKQYAEAILWGKGRPKNPQKGTGWYPSGKNASLTLKCLFLMWSIQWCEKLLLVPCVRNVTHLM